MKKLDIDKLSPDPFAAAVIGANYETAVVSGYIRSTDRDTISICKNRLDKSTIEFSRKSIVAAFNFDEKSTKVIFLIKKDTEIRSIKYRAVGGHDCHCSDDNDTGISERIPLPPELRKINAELAAVLAYLDRTRSPDLACAAEHHNCTIGGLGEDLCDFLRTECQMGF